MSLSPLLREAMRQGAVHFAYGSISGCPGYVDFSSRTIVVDERWTPDEQEAAQEDGLRELLARDGVFLDLPSPRAGDDRRLRLIDGTG